MPGFNLPTPEIDGKIFNYWYDNQYTHYNSGEMVTDFTSWYRADMRDDSHHVNFIVLDNIGNAIAEAEISSVDTIVTSDEFGTANFGKVLEGTYDYSASADGFQTTSGSFTVQTTDINIEVRMQEMDTSNIWQLLTSNPLFEVWGFSGEQAAADTVIGILSENYYRIATSLGTELSQVVRVDIYPDLESYHTAMGWEDAPDWSVGSAIVEANIKLVTPFNPGPVHTFASIMEISVHEMIHCFVSKISNYPLPIWINEGTATYFAYQGPPSAAYLQDLINQNGGLPTLNDLNNGSTFGDIGGYTWSYTIVEFIVEQLGSSTMLSQFLASNTDYTLLGFASAQDFEIAWHNYINSNYTEQVSITFRVDLRNQPEVLDGVYFKTSIDNWNELFVMSQSANNEFIYELSLEAPVNSTVEYKFRKDQLWETIIGDCTVGDFANRSITIGTTDTILEAVCFSECNTCQQLAPVALIYVNETYGVAPLTLYFSDISANNPDQWLWDFGDGTQSTLQHPEHTYQSAGKYQVSLIAANNTGTDTTIYWKEINVAGSTVDVTFQVNMSKQGEFYDNVYLRDSYSNWGRQTIMTDNGNGIYSCTVPVAANDTLYYIFQLGYDNEPLNGVCAVEKDGYMDRIIQVGNQDMLLEPVCFGECENCQSQTYTLTCNDVTITNGEITACTYDFSLTDIIIPDTLCGQVVNGIGLSVFENAGISSVVLPSGLQIIKAWAFYGNNLSSINFSPCTNLQQIWDGAFYNNNLADLDLRPCSNLAEIGSYAFRNNNLENVWFPGSIIELGIASFNGNNITQFNDAQFDGCFYAYNNDGSIDYTTLVSFGKHVETFILPSNAVNIANIALIGCGFNAVDFSQAHLLEKIGFSAFDGNNIVSVDLSSCISLVEIGERAFDNNPVLGFNLPNPIRAGYRFENWIDNFANDYAGGTWIDNLSASYAAVFNEINAYTLSCNDVTISNGEIIACSYDFSNTDLIIPDTLCGEVVRGIGYRVFRFKNVITSVQLPSTLEFIEESAFEHNQIDLLDLRKCTGLTSIGENAFIANSITKVFLPNSLTSLGGGCFNANNISEVNGLAFNDGFFYAFNPDGSQDSTELISYGKRTASVTIPAQVTRIANNALNGIGLTSVDLSQCLNLNYIGYRAFFGNQIPSIDLSFSRELETIDNSGFLYSGLNNIDLSSCTKLSFIGGAAFASNNFSSFYLPIPEQNGMQFENWTDGYQNILAGGEIVTDLDVWYRANFTQDSLLPMEINVSVMDPFCYGGQGVLEVSISGGLGGSYTNGGQLEEALTDSNAYVVMVYDINAQNFAFERVLADYSDSAIFSVNPGTYNVIVEDAAGNDWQQMVVVQEPERLEMDAFAIGSALCPGETDEVIVAEALGGVEPYLFSVYRNGDLYYDYTVIHAFAVPVGAQYEVYVRDANGCLVSKTIDVDQINAIDWQVEAATCYGDQEVTAQIIVEDGVPGRNYVGFYSLYENGVLVSTDTTDFFENEVHIDGLFYDNDDQVDRNYSFLIMDDWGCISEETFVAFNPVQEPLLITINELNVGEFSADIQIQINGGTAPYRLELDGVEIEDLFQTIATGAHSLLGEDAHQCFVRDTFWIGPDLDCPQHFHPVWEGSGVYDPMNIYVINARIDRDNLQAGDQIGVFDGDVCVGFGKVEETIDQQNVLSIIAGADDGTGIGFTPGHEISYKIWRCSDETEFDVSDAYCFDNQLDPVDCSAFQPGASSFVDLFVSTQRFFATGFQPGWNIFSLPVLPDAADMEYNFYDLIQSGSLVKIQDETGASFENMGVFGDWNNEIGDIRLTEGYKVKVTEYDSLYFSGSPVKYPYGIPLNQGWNIMGFPSFSYVNGMEVVQQLIGRGTLIKVQDEQGKSIEDMGIYGGWQNFIGNFWAGEGYKIKVNSLDTLWIQESYPKSLAIVSDPFPTKHFKIGIPGNGVDHMNFNLVELPNAGLNAGDEIAVYDGSTCVGAMVITEAHLRNRLVSIPVSATDDSGMPGFTEGNKYSLRTWKADQNREIEMVTEHLSGPKLFTKHESVILSLEKSALTKTDEWNGNGTTEVKCYPNPFSEEVTIELRLATNADVEIEALNQMGHRVKYLAPKQQLNAGIHRLAWDGTNTSGGKVSPGIYYLKIILDDLIISEKMVYNK